MSGVRQRRQAHLDRLPPQVELEGADAAGDAAATAGEPALRRASLLVFRLHREWLGLPTRALDEVAAARPVLPLPHRRDPAVLGVTNVRGTLTVCLSLARLLGLEAAGPEPRERAGAARMLIFGGAGRAVVLPVDEVEAFIPSIWSGWNPASHGGGRQPEILARRCGGYSVGVLDETLLMQALERSLA